MNKQQLLGSQTAKNGFLNEDEIVNKFNNWLLDEDAQKWLLIMQYDLEVIEYVKAVKVSGYKTDVQAQVTIQLKGAIGIQNLQVKLVRYLKGFNQIVKRWIDTYVEMWDIPDNISINLKQYTGELAPSVTSLKDKRRMFAFEFSVEEQDKIHAWLSKNKSLIVSDILKGSGQFSAEWMLVAQKTVANSKWILKRITKRVNFKIGRITMQRKSGDGGRITSNMPQFKINPAELFQL